MKKNILREDTNSLITRMVHDSISNGTAIVKDEHSKYMDYIKTYLTEQKIDYNKISKIKIPLLIEKEDVNYTILKGLDGMTARIFNQDVIDGTLRVSIEETEDFGILHKFSIKKCLLYLIQLL